MYMKVIMYTSMYAYCALCCVVMIAHDNKKARHFAGFVVCCLVIFIDSLFDILNLFVEYWLQCRIVAGLFLMRF